MAANGKKYVALEFSFDAVLATYLREFRRRQNSTELCLTNSAVTDAVRTGSSEFSL